MNKKIVLEIKVSALSLTQTLKYLKDASRQLDIKKFRNQDVILNVSGWAKQTRGKQRHFWEPLQTSPTWFLTSSMSLLSSSTINTVIIFDNQQHICPGVDTSYRERYFVLPFNWWFSKLGLELNSWLPFSTYLLYTLAGKS